MCSGDPGLAGSDYGLCGLLAAALLQASYDGRAASGVKLEYLGKHAAGLRKGLGHVRGIVNNIIGRPPLLVKWHLGLLPAAQLLPAPASPNGHPTLPHLLAGPDEH